MKKALLVILPYLIAGGVGVASYAAHSSNALEATIGALLVSMLAHYNLGQDPKALAGKSDAADAAKKVGGVVLLLALAHSTTACLAATPQVPVTPANASQVSSCSNTAAWHNGFIVGDFVVGGLGGAAGVAGSLVTDQGQKTALAVTAGVAGALTAAGAAVAGYTANKYVSDACPTYTGPLPLGKPHAAGGLR